MAGDTDSEMKNVSANSNLNIDNYRKLVQTYLNLVSQLRYVTLTTFDNKYINEVRLNY